MLIHARDHARHALLTLLASLVALACLAVPAWGFSDGDYVRTDNGTIYRIAGGSPLYVTYAWWTATGGGPVTEISYAQLAAFPPFPAEGTLLGASDGGVFRVAGGAPLWVSDWSAIGGPQPTVPADAWDIDNAGQPQTHLNKYPADGTLLGASDGGVYRVAGGAPLYVSDWNAIGGPQPSVPIDGWDVHHAGTLDSHLRQYPANGTFVNTSAGHVYRIAGGAPILVTSWAVFGGQRASVGIDNWDITNVANPAAHLRLVPRDGTLVKGLPSGRYWRFVHGRRVPAAPSPAAVAVDDKGLVHFRLLHSPTVPNSSLLASIYVGRRTKLASLTVFGTLAGSKLRLTCLRHCRHFSATRTSKGGKTVVRLGKRRTIERSSELELVITRPGYAGRRVIFRVSPKDASIVRIKTNCIGPVSHKQIHCH